MVTGNVLQRQQGLFFGGGDQAHADPVMHAGGQIVRLVQQFQNDAVASFFFAILDRAEGDSLGSAPEPELARRVGVDTGAKTVENLTANFGRMGSGGNLIGVGDGVHDAQHGTGPGLQVGVGVADQEASDIGVVFDLGRHLQTGVTGARGRAEQSLEEVDGFAMDFAHLVLVDGRFGFDSVTAQKFVGFFDRAQG